MSRPKKPILPSFLLLLAIAAIPSVLLVILRPSPVLYVSLARAFALWGYLFVFFSIVSANYMQQLVRRFGRSFVSLHHWASITGLVLVTIHAIFIALAAERLSVFIPDTSSWRNFWIFAGRPSWYLLLIAAAAALLRQRLKDSWLIVHYLNYVAFFMGTVHAAMGGSSFLPSPGLRAIIYLLTVLTIVVFVLRRVQEKQRARARNRRRRQRNS